MLLLSILTVLDSIKNSFYSVHCGGKCKSSSCGYNAKSDIFIHIVNGNVEADNPNFVVMLVMLLPQNKEGKDLLVEFHIHNKYLTT